jgi:hypothetical protein
VISILPGQGIDSTGLDTDFRKEFNLVLAKKLTQYLAGFRYYYIPTTVLLRPTQLSIYDIQQRLSKDPKFKPLVAQANFDFLPLISPAQASFEPSDPLYQNSGQWNLDKIGAIGGWNSGAIPILGETVVVAVIDDSGVEYFHEDFAPVNESFVQGATFSGSSDPPDINETPLDQPGAGGRSDSGFHGTACAGIIAARYNMTGIAGLAGGCQLMSLRVWGYQSVLVAAAINYASGVGAGTTVGTRSSTPQANVISMSFVDDPISLDPTTGIGPLESAEIRTALSKAFDDRKVVLCGATGDSGQTPPYYPAADPHVIACGASNTLDNRVISTWQSAYGGQLSVVAPGIDIPTTDLTGINGRSPNNYSPTFWGTSAATPHVAGLAALLMAKYSSLKGKPDSVRKIIEQTAEKVGQVTLGSSTASLTYSDTPNKLHGDWNQETGYGRINVDRALRFADMTIKKHPDDTGLEPFTPPSYDFSLSDLVVRTAEDVTLANFDSINSIGSKVLITGVDHYLYVRVTNLGPEAAQDVTVSVRITKKRANPFTLNDWTNTTSPTTHIKLEKPGGGAPLFPLVPAGSGFQALAKFLIPTAVVTTISAWISSSESPRALAQVTSQNDYAFSETKDWTSGDLLLRKNNLIQATLSVGSGKTSGDTTPPGAPCNLRVH